MQASCQFHLMLWPLLQWALGQPPWLWTRGVPLSCSCFFSTFSVTASDKDGPALPPLSPELLSMRFQGLAEDVAENMGWRMREESGRRKESCSDSGRIERQEPFETDLVPKLHAN